VTLPKKHPTLRKPSDPSKFTKLPVPSLRPLTPSNPPLLQCAKEFANDAAGAEAYRDINTDVFSAKNNVLAKFISTKETEVEFFMENFVGKTAAGKIVLEAVNGAASSLEGSLMGSEHVTPHVLKELQALKEMAGLYASQAVALGFAAYRSTLERKMKKMSLVETTQVEMTDSISTATIEKVVNDALKRHSTSFSRKRKNTGPPKPAKRQRANTQGERRPPGPRPSKKPKVGVPGNRVGKGRKGKKKGKSRK